MLLLQDEVTVEEPARFEIHKLNVYRRQSHQLIGSIPIQYLLFTAILITMDFKYYSDWIYNKVEDDASCFSSLMCEWGTFPPEPQLHNSIRSYTLQYFVIKIKMKLDL